MNLDELERVIKNQNAAIRRRLPGGVTQASSRFKKQTSTHTLAVAKSTLALDQAADALALTHSALAQLARRATGPKRVEYKALMDVVLAELKVVTQAILDHLGQMYRPMTSALKAASAKLAAAYKSAQDTISGLSNAATLLSGFGSLISAIR